MTGQRGFSLIELLVVIAIMGTLGAIASLQFGAMQQKAAVERQVREVYTKLNEVRMEAFYTKTPRAVLLDVKDLKIYATDDVAVPPVSVISYSYPMTMSSTANRVVYDSTGMMNLSDRSICVEPGGAADNPGNIDSVIVAASRIYMGKRQGGATCAPANIDQK